MSAALQDPAPAPLLRAEKVGKRFGGFVALAEVDLVLRPGERLGLIGPNGSGKSTFVNCISGDFAQHDGSVTLAGAKLDGLKPHARARRGLARTFQLPQPFRSLTVLENVRVPLLFGGHAADATERAMACLEQVELAAKAARLPRELTQVEQRRLELARAIALDPQLLIADEAMAGLSHAEVDQIIALLLRLNAAGTAVIMIEHIMRAVTEFSERLIVFVAGRKIADGAPREVLAMPEVEGAYLGKQ
ncbi:ABC transporter ATP-binding protein [Siccirubricoccus phaeus]|uniref:ABC transporter ATP-binding protein n=1 Tax=Siccirubricoccus phaeus TaxID=2595053 RepID=UPI0011F0BD5B|nr:ABC transporter ATP-binding protein [Siccirubricoccus phaeus]